jgi:hypothetical protein
MRRTKRHKSPRTRRSHAKRNHLKPKAARAPRKPKVCEKCGFKLGDGHDKDAHYNAMLRRMGISIQEGAE